MSFANLKGRFPIFSNKQGLVYLDSAATTQKPEVVINRLQKFYLSENANIHRGIYELGENATRLYEQAREKVAGFIGANANELVFTRNATEAINLVAYSWAASNLEEGDVIVLTVMEHHSNLVPWLAFAANIGCELRVVGLDVNGELDIEDFNEAMELNPKLVTFCSMSNVLGNIQDVRLLCEKAKGAGAVTLVDACQSVARMPIDVKDWGCDFMAFSGHKMYGPMGIGGLYIRHKLMASMQPFIMGGGMIEKVTWTDLSWAVGPAKFEGGTPNVAGAIGLAAAVDFLEQLEMNQVWDHDQELTRYAIKQLDSIDSVRILGTKNVENRGGTISFVVEGVHSFDLVKLADTEYNVSFRAGHHCCQPLMTELGLDGTVRMSFGVYTTKDDVDRAIEAIIAAIDLFK